LSFYDPQRCWADVRRMSFETQFSVPCFMPSETDLGLCRKHHAEIVPKREKVPA